MNEYGGKRIAHLPDSVARWCLQGIEELPGKYTPHRNDYRLAVELLKRMKAVGPGTQASDEAQRLHKLYANRSALLQTLKEL